MLYNVVVDHTNIAVLEHNPVQVHTAKSLLPLLGLMLVERSAIEMKDDK